MLGAWVGAWVGGWNGWTSGYVPPPTVQEPTRGARSELGGTVEISMSLRGSVEVSSSVVDPRGSVMITGRLL